MPKGYILELNIFFIEKFMSISYSLKSYKYHSIYATATCCSGYQHKRHISLILADKDIVLTSRKKHFDLLYTP